jgi:tRNA(Ile)-lysidine synthase
MRAMSALETQVERVLEAAGLAAGRIVLGLSGGMDSMVLLEALARIARRGSLRLRALHVNHQISSNAAAWMAHCGQRCAALGIAFEAARVALPERKPSGLEATARTLRYDVFRAQDADAVALAHHRDDQAETILLQMTRGAGVRGLSGMPLVRVLNRATGLRLIRPLLEVPRSAIAAYARERDLAWVEDESNACVDLDRNFVRHAILPRLAERFPAYAQTWARAALNLSDLAALADEVACDDARGAIRSEALGIERLRALSLPRARNLLRWYLATQDLQPLARAQLNALLDQLLAARADANPSLELGGAVVYRHRGALHVRPRARRARTDWRLRWRGEPLIALPSGAGTVRMVEAIGAGLSLARLRDREVTLRPRGGGERLRLAPGAPSRTLKNLLQEAGVPTWMRARLPLLFVDEALAWVPRVGADCRFAVGTGEPGVLPEWIPDESSQDE